MTRGETIDWGKVARVRPYQRQQVVPNSDKRRYGRNGIYLDANSLYST